MLLQLSIAEFTSELNSKQNSVSRWSVIGSFPFKIKSTLLPVVELQRRINMKEYVLKPSAA